MRQPTVLSTLVPSVDTNNNNSILLRGHTKKRRQGWQASRRTSNKERTATENNCTRKKRVKEDVKCKDLRQIVRHLEGEKVSVSSCRSKTVCPKEIRLIGLNMRDS